MPYTLDFDPANRLVVARVFGEDTVEAHLERMRRTVKDPQWRSGYRVLVDLRGVTTSDHRYDNLEKITEFHAQHVDAIGPTKVAAIAEDDLIFGLRRMMDLFADGNTRVVSEVFKTWADALSWLDLPEDYEPPSR